MYFHCQTTLVDTFKEMYQDVFKFGGNRSINFSENDKVPAEALSQCISLALTYHLNKKQGNRSTESKHIIRRSTGHSKTTRQ